jgi:hypothetical protein
MDLWTNLYEAPTAISPEWGHHRIFSPLAYRRVREMPVVPIAHSEVLSLAQHYPTCWVDTPAGPCLSVLRALTHDGQGLPPVARKILGSLPGALQAYPIVVPQSMEALSEPVRVDRTIAEDPTDVGAPLLMAHGRFSRAVALRTRAALKLGRALATTRSLATFLREEGLLEPWPLVFDLGAGEEARFENLHVLARSKLGERAVYRAFASFGADAALFLCAHRISLFRVSALLAAARAAVAASAAGNRVAA